MSNTYDGFNTSDEIICAIEEITGYSLLDENEELGPNQNSNPAIQFWSDGSDQEKVLAYINKNYDLTIQTAAFEEGEILLWGDSSWAKFNSTTEKFELIKHQTMVA